MSLAKKIQALYEDKATLVKTMETMAEKDLNEDEESDFDDMSVELKKIDARIKRFEALEQEMARDQAEPVTRAPATVEPQIEKDPNRAKFFIAKQAQAIYLAGGNALAASQYAKEVMKDDLVARALVTSREEIQKAAVAPGDSTTAGYAAELVQINQLNSAFVELLRPMSVLLRFPGRQLSFDGYGSIKIPRQSGGTSGSWFAEGSAIPVGAAAFDTVELTPKNVGQIVVATDELMRRSTPSALSILSDDLLSGIATTIDSVFVSNGSGVSNTPDGLQTYGTRTAGTAGGGLDAATTDLSGMISRLLSADMPMISPVWILHPSLATSLRFMRDGLGGYAFQNEMNAGTLMGYPYLESTVSDSATIILADANQVLIATDPVPSLSISNDASVHMESAPADDIGGAATPVRSLWQTNSVGIRAISIMDYNTRYANCVETVHTITW